MSKGEIAALIFTAPIPIMFVVWVGFNIYAMVKDFVEAVREYNE